MNTFVLGQLGQRQSHVVVLIMITVVGCNPYRTPQTIAPTLELERSEFATSLGPATLRIPRGWVIASEERRDSLGRPQSVLLKRFDQRGHIGSLLFDVDDEAPRVPTEVEVECVSTEFHERVTFSEVFRDEPSGCSNRGFFALDSYVEAEGKFYVLHASFSTPVQPQLRSAVYYIDAISCGEHSESTSKKMKTGEEKKTGPAR